MEYKLDMSGMLATHDALRRDLVQVARIAGRRNGDPATRLHAVLGWELFKKFLIIHHQTEDDVLWPLLRTAVAGHPDRLALVDELETEHTVIEPLLAGIDAAAADPDYGYQRFGDIIDELEGKLTVHLAHEESDGLPLIDASLPPQDWQHYSAVYAERIGDDASLAIPWLLDGASPQNREAFLSNLLAPMVATLRDQWEPRYASLNRWGTPGEPPAGQ